MANVYRVRVNGMTTGDTPASNAAVAVKSVLGSMGVVHTRYYGDRVGPLKLGIGESVSVTVERVK